MADSTLYEQSAVLYHVLCPNTRNPFSRAFIETHLSPIDTLQDAMSIGVLQVRPECNDSESDADDDEDEPLFTELQPSVSERSVFMNPCKVIQIAHRYFTNSCSCTVAGKYGVKGMTLPSDLMVWSRLMAPVLTSATNPVLESQHREFARLLDRVEFRPEATDVVKVMCKALATAAFCMEHHFKYRNPGSLSGYVRFLNYVACLTYREVEDAWSSLSNGDAYACRSLMNCLNSRKKKGRSGPLQKAVMDKEYVSRVNVMFERAQIALCGCDECTSGSRHMTTRAVGRQNVVEPHLFVLNYPEMGPVNVPTIKHMSVDEQIAYCEGVRGDCLCSYAKKIKVWKDVLDPDTLPVKPDYSHLLSERARFLTMVANFIVLCQMTQLAAAVLKCEICRCVVAVKELTQEVSEIVTRQSDLFAGGGLVESKAARSQHKALRRLSARLRGLNFGGGSGLIFLPAMGELLKLSTMVSEYSEINEIQTREELLLHVMFLRRMYDDTSEDMYRAERLVQFALRHGCGSPYTPQDVSRTVTVVGENELCNLEDPQTTWPEVKIREFRIGPTCQSYVWTFANMFKRRNAVTDMCVWAYDALPLDYTSCGSEGGAAKGRSGSDGERARERRRAGAPVSVPRKQVKRESGSDDTAGSSRSTDTSSGEDHSHGGPPDFTISGSGFDPDIVAEVADEL
uniref:GP27 n=1 Tax=Caviid herpesvirus 2 str. CIDMTR TaxID=1415526 RepID=U6H6M3_9BETA|nr:GP27 [Caviid herpesvirus 2 str. CIDMTR]